MNRPGFIAVFFSFLCAFSLPIQRPMLECSTPTDPSILLDDQLREELSKPNKWGYKIQWAFGPHMSPNGLTYRIHFLADMWGRRLESLNEAEELQCSIYKNSLQIVNSIRCIRPFLGEFPLTPDSFQVSIGFADERGNNLPPPNLASVIMDSKKLEFNQFIGKSCLQLFNTFLVKEINKVPELLLCYHPTVNRSQAQTRPIAVPRYMAPPDRCNGPYGKALFLLSKKICVENNLNLTAFANVCGYTNSSTPFEAAFWGNHTLSLTDARKLTAQLSFCILQFVRTNTEALKRLQVWKENHPSTSIANVATPANIALRLSFWDENIDRQPEPYIAEVQLRDGKATYYTADEKQFLKQVFEESFGDDQKILEQQNSETINSHSLSTG